MEGGQGHWCGDPVQARAVEVREVEGALSHWALCDFTTSACTPKFQIYGIYFLFKVVKIYPAGK